MKKTYYIFRGRADCGPCGAKSGRYTVRPGKPHKGCICNVVTMDEGNCGNFKYNGTGWPGDPSMNPVLDIAGGHELWRIKVVVTMDDGTTTTEIIEVDVPTDMDFDDKMEAIGHAAEDKAEEIEDCPFLCC